MMNLSSLLGLLGLGGDILKTRIARRLMKDIAGVIAWAIATVFMAGALLVGLFWLAYRELVRFGLAPEAAFVFITVSGFFAVFALFRATRRKIRMLKTAAKKVMPGSAAFKNRVFMLADSFLDGLLEPRTSGKHR